MCGIVGIVSRYSNGFSQDEGNAFTDMLVIDSFRGLDSTGVFSVDKHSNVEIIKEASHGLDFVLEQDFKNWRTNVVQRGLITIGHNRAATRGTVSDKNAHPFYVDDKIVLVQNGTMRGDHTTLAKGSKEVEVDSEAIAHLLSEESDIEKALQKVNAAYVLVWYNTETKKLHIIRNDERPLFYAENEPFGMIFASEKPTIEYVMSKYSLKYNEITLLPPGELMTLDISDKDYHYKKELVKIDAKFRFTGSHSNRRVHEVLDSEWVGWYGGLGGENDEVVERTLPFHRKYNSTPAAGPLLLPGKPTTTLGARPGASSNSEHAPIDLRIQFNDIVIQNLTEYHIDPIHVNGIIEQGLKCQQEDGRTFIEAQGYFPTNHHPNCRSWWVWGEIISPDEVDNVKNILIYWLVHDQTKIEIEDYIEKSFFSCRIASLQTELFKDKGVKRAAIRGFATSARPFLETTVIRELKTNEPH